MRSNGRLDPDLRYRALLIGNAIFACDPEQLPPLPGPEYDLGLLKKRLCDQEVGLHDEGDVIDLFQEGRKKIWDVTAEFFGKGRPGEQLLFYYSGHGRRTLDERQLYLCAADTVAHTDADLVGSGISCQEISSLISASKATAKVIILDCCHAGAFPARPFGIGPFGLLSARDFNRVPAAGSPHQASPFTQCLAEALRLASPRPNETRHPFLTLEDVYFYILDHLPSDYKAKPIRQLPPNAYGTVALGRVRGVTPEPREALESSAAQPPRGRLLPDSVITLNGPPPMVWVPIGQSGFWMSEHVVTNRQFAEFLNDEVNARWRPGREFARNEADRYYLEHWPSGVFDPEQGNYPVVSVSAMAAQAYARWAGDVSGQSLRLPRLGEWFEAARAGRSPSTFVRDDIEHGRVNFFETERLLTEVGTFSSNPYGIRDLIGNIREFCLYDDSRRAEDGVLMCGGSYESRRSELASNESIGLRTCRPDTGFRCVGEGPT